MAELRATPMSNPIMGLLADRLKKAQQFGAKPFGYENPPVEMLMNLLGVPAVQQTMERMAYGEPLTTGSGMTTKPRAEAVEAAMAVAPVAGLLGKVTKGLPVGASIENVGKDLSAINIGDRTIPVTINRIDKKSGGQLVNVNPSAFDEAFSKTGWQYVGEKGKDGISGRYEKFENYLKDAKSIEASNVSVNKDGGIVFGDGRHRYAVLRDMGLDELPIVMDKESIKNAKKFGYLSDSPKNPIAPRQEALDKAQRNAALPVEEGGLGLPKDNTPEMRADAMGFDLETYHGTNTPDITSIEINKSRPDVQYMQGFFTSDDPNLASNYGDILMPLLQKKGTTILDRRAARQAGLEVPEMDTIYDKEKNILVTNNPANIRSRFAAFDPMRRNEADILAGVLPLGLLADEEQRKKLYELVPSLLGQ
jgi:hypothetical protein